MQNCYAAGCVSVGRVALVDDCTGEPIPGDNNGYTFGGITAVTWEPVIEEGTDTTVKDMCGNVCMKDVQCDQTTAWNVEITLCRPDNELVSLLTGEPVILDLGGNTIGYFQLDDSNCAPFVSLELFEKIPDSQCSSDVQYRRIIFPKIRITQTAPEREGPIRLLKLSGTAESSFGSGWADGPFDDSPVDYSVALGPNDKFFISEVYELTAPSPACGYTPVGETAVTFSALTDGGACTIDVTGTGFASVDHIFVSADTGSWTFYNPTSPNVGFQLANTVINTWSGTNINVTYNDPDNEADLCGGCVEDIQFLDIDGFPIIPDQVIDPCVDISSPPAFMNAFSPECDHFRIEGTNLDQVAYIVTGFSNGSQNAYGPLWPTQVADNIGEGNTIIEWSATGIEFSSTTIPTGTSLGIAFFNASNVQIGEYDNTDIQPVGGYAPFNVFPCPTITAAESPECERIVITGTHFDVVNHMVLSGSISVDYYDPAGPDAGLNPGTATINTWTSTTIDITDTQLGGQDFSAADLLALGDTPDFGLISFVDISIDDCLPGFTLGGEAAGQFFQASSLEDGSYYSAVTDGNGTTVSVYKYDATGQLDGTWGTAGVATVDFVNGSQYAGHIALASDGSLFLTAQTYLNPGPTNNRATLMKFDTAGTLVAAFGTAGIVKRGNDNLVQLIGLALDSSDNPVIAWRKSTAEPVVERFDFTTGAVTETVTLGVGDGAPCGLVRVDDDNYILATVNGGTVKYAAVDLNALSYTIVTHNEIYPSDFTPLELALYVDGTGSLYSGGYGPTGNPAVMKLDPTLASLDTSWDGDGIAEFNIGNAAFNGSGVRDIMKLTAGGMVVSGQSIIAGVRSQFTARLDSIGTLVGSYGTAGIATVDIDPSEEFHGGSILSADELTTTHVGYIGASPNTQTYIARTLVSDGSLDNTFGT